MKILGKVAQFILLVIVLSASLDTLGQENVRVITQSNLRGEPNTSSAIIAVLHAGDTVTVLEEVTGQSVTMYGRTSSVWFRVISGQQEGYLWSLLVETSIASTGIDPNYPLLVCENCRYQSLVITEMQWYGSNVEDSNVFNIRAVIDTLYTIRGRNIWIGYDDGGFDMPDDASLEYRLVFRVESNTLGGPLMYNNTLYNQLVLENDEIQVWFWYSETSLEYYVFPFVSMTRTCTPTGEHCGEHLSGAYAIPATEMERMVEVVGI